MRIVLQRTDVLPRLSLAAVLACSALLLASWVLRPWTAGDTPFVLDGTDALIDCLAERDLVACRLSEELSYWGLTSPIGDWPLLQHLPDLVAVELGINGHHGRELILVLLGVTGLAFAVFTARVVLTRIGQAAWFWGFMLVVLSGPFLAYARSTAGETLAAALLVLLVAAVLLPAHPVLVALAAFGASVTKETAYPFVAALALVGLLLARRRTGRPIAGHAVAGGAGIAVALVTASLLNMVRFGSVLNTNYLEPELHTSGLGRILEYSLALYLSPSGGMVVFWPAATALVAGACLLPLLRRGRRLDLIPALVLIVVTTGLTLGFASWWTPFGWSGYGPRLTLPWVLPLVLLALAAYGGALARPTRRLLEPAWRLLLVWAGVLAFALPHVGQLWDPDASGRFFSQRSPPCDAPWRGGVDEWHECQHQQLWFDRPMPLYALRGVGSVGGGVTSVVLGLGLLGCLVLLRAELARNDSRTVTSGVPAQRA